MKSGQEGVQGPQERIATILEAHRWGIFRDDAGFAHSGCMCKDIEASRNYPAHVAAAVVEALGLTEEWGFKSDDESHPFSAGTWDRAAAVDAANYNNARWGDKYHAVFRYVSKWQWETFYDGAEVVIKTVRRRPNE